MIRKIFTALFLRPEDEGDFEAAKDRAYTMLTIVAIAVIAIVIMVGSIN